MRIMIDTNILVSVVVFKSKQLEQMLTYICDNHILVLSTYIIDELNEVIKIKFPGKTSAMDGILFNLPFELEYTPHTLPGLSFKIRDKNDEPILYSAITADVDILITGDKDFVGINTERPRILCPADFIAEYKIK